MDSKKVVMALSGGMDSATVLGFCLHQGYEVMSFGFNYGSKHNPFELVSARRIAESYGVDFRIVDLSNAFQGLRSNLMEGQGDIPEGHYTDKSMSQTVVPGRNMIFLSILAGYAWSVGAGEIAIGIHQGDHAIYPDCRKEFYMGFGLGVYLGTDRKVEILAPFLDTDKVGILKWGLVHRVPYHLTRTCYKDQSVACGKCGSCVERLEAFQKIGVQDPIPYE